MSSYSNIETEIKTTAKNHYLKIKKLEGYDRDDYMLILGDVIVKQITTFDKINVSLIWKSVFTKSYHLVEESIGIVIFNEIQRLLKYGIDKKELYTQKKEEFKNTEIEPLIDYIFSDKGILFSSMTLINVTGDVTLTWEAEQDKKMRELVQAKLDEGYGFFIMEPRFKFLNFLGNKKIHITDTKQIKGNSVTMETEEDAQKILFQKIKLGDKKAEEVFLGGIVSIANVPQNNYSTSKRTINVEEIIHSHTVVTNKIAGG